MNINEIASELENSNNRNENENENKSKEKSEKIQNIINKVEPMNINMNINKIENLNLHNSNRNNKTIKSPKISKKTNNTFMTANENQPQAKNMKEAHIVEIGAKILPPPAKITKRYTSNSNNIITAKDKENINK